MRDDVLIALVLVFVPFSLSSIGGGGAVLAGIQHQTVEVYRWASSREFIEFFAISRAAPGPGTMIVTLIGWKVAGWPGAIVATVAIILPSSLLCFGVLKATNPHREKKWHRAMREGLAPVGVGLTLAGVLSVFRISNGGVLDALLAISAAALLLCMPKLPALAILCLGATASVLMSMWST